MSGTATTSTTMPRMSNSFLFMTTLSKSAARIALMSTIAATGPSTTTAALTIERCEKT